MATLPPTASTLSGSTPQTTPSGSGIAGLMNTLGLGTSSGFGGTPLFGSAPAATTPQAPNLSLSPPTLSPFAAPIPKLPPPTSPTTQQQLPMFGSQAIAANNGSGAASLSNLVSSKAPLPSGGYGTTDTQGNVISPTSYSINTNNLTSDALSHSLTANDVGTQLYSYQHYVQQLAQASGYSPDYIAAYTQSQRLSAAEAATQQNLATGNVGGDTEGYAETATNRTLAGLSAEKSFADINLAAQALIRQGNIQGAQALVQGYAPTSVSPGSSLVSPATGQPVYSGLGGLVGVNAVNQYNSLQQLYPNANIPPYNQSLSPEVNQQIAQHAVANSPAYQAQFVSPFTTAGGGTGLYSKLNLNGLQQNSDGTLSLVPAAAAAIGSANADIINKSLGNLSSINIAIKSSEQTLATTQQFMQQYGLNDAGLPILNQIQQNIKDQTTQQAAVTGFRNDLAALREDYSQYLIARGGSVAGSGIDSPEVLNTIPDTISVNGLAQVVNQMQVVGQNTASSVNAQVQSAIGALGGSGTQNTGVLNTSQTGSSSGGVGWY